jgi:hypothetical protein
MHVANKGGLLPGQEQEHVAGPGRPSDPGTFGTHASPHGRDPLAIKQVGKTFSADKSPLQHQYKSGSPLSTENKEISSLINSLKSQQKTSKIIQETLSKNEKNTDDGTILDESQLIDE